MKKLKAAPKKAVELARKACELSEWKDAINLDTLAAAYAAVGRYEDAVKWQKKALEDATFPKSEVAEAKKRLELYENDKPYRQPKD